MNPKGGVKEDDFSPETIPNSRDSRKGQCTRNKRIAGRCVRQPVKTKFDFISARQAARTGNKTDQPMYLCVIKATENLKTTKKRKSKASAAKGMTEGQRR